MTKKMNQLSKYFSFLSTDQSMNQLIFAALNQSTKVLAGKHT